MYMSAPISGKLPFFDCYLLVVSFFFFFFSSRRRHTRFKCDWSSDVCSSDLKLTVAAGIACVLLFLLPGSPATAQAGDEDRSEERRVGKECRSRWSPYH